MRHIKIAVCSGEQGLVDAVRHRIFGYANAHRFEAVVDRFCSIKKLFVSKTAFDIIFLDYQMEDTEQLNALHRLREQHSSCAMMLLTGYPDFVCDICEVMPFRLFGKPLDDTKLFAALDDYLKANGTDFPFLLQQDRQTIMVNIREIMFLEAEQKRCRANTVDGT